VSGAENRRPLKVRGAELPKRFAMWLSRKSVTPNQISLSSVFFAMLAAACLLALPHIDSRSAQASAILAALFIQCRLLCDHL
jgi:phosphatidylglycerophosphate synthase